MKLLKQQPWMYGFLCFMIGTIEIFLMTTNAKPWLKIYIAIAPFLAVYLGHWITQHGHRTFFKEIQERLAHLDEKYFITEMIPTPYFEEGEAFYELVLEISKDVADRLQAILSSQQDYKEYIEMWVHEIKIPIATSKMILENHPHSESRSLNEELDKIDRFTEQALYYAKSNVIAKDYHIKKICLEDLVKEAIKKNRSLFIQTHVTFSMEGLDMTIATDEKWLVFIISQIISNSCKYAHHMTFKGVQTHEGIVLEIADDGIGIPASDVPRIFEKGYVGENGRTIHKKSTGIGLYLCRKLCDQLHLGLTCQSIYHQGTTMCIHFPKGSFTLQ